MRSICRDRRVGVFFAAQDRFFVLGLLCIVLFSAVFFVDRVFSAYKSLHQSQCHHRKKKKKMTTTTESENNQSPAKEHKRKLSTLATLETLGIRIRPPGFHPPLSSLYAPRLRHDVPLLRRPLPPAAMHPGSMRPHQVNSTVLDPAATNTGVNGFPSGYWSAPAVQQDPSAVAAGASPWLPELDQNVFSWNYGFPDSDPTMPLLPYDSNNHTNQALLAGFEQLPPYPESDSNTFSEYSPDSTLSLMSSNTTPISSISSSQPDSSKDANSLNELSSSVSHERPAPYGTENPRKRRFEESECSSTADQTSLAMPEPSKASQQTSMPSLSESSSLPATSAVSSSLTLKAPVLRSAARDACTEDVFSIPISLNPAGTLPMQDVMGTVRSGGRFLNGYSGTSEPPDLLAPLKEKQSNPPREDMEVEDAAMIPCKQELRFEDDLYTPKWVRGHGSKREGWCGICKPGRWLLLKNSAFWYDKSFSHGVCAATGRAFDLPQQTRRMEGTPDIWEGLCGRCGNWIPLVSSKKQGTTWFRHCYQHSKKRKIGS